MTLRTPEPLKPRQVRTGRAQQSATPKNKQPRKNPPARNGDWTRPDKATVGKAVSADRAAKTWAVRFRWSCLTSLLFVTLETAINAITYVFATLAGYPLRRRKTKCDKIPCSIHLWNPTLAHRTRKDGAPGCATGRPSATKSHARYI
jgi:hypothetical protein